MANPDHPYTERTEGLTESFAQMLKERKRHAGWNILSDSDHCLHYRAIADKPWCCKIDKRCTKANCPIKIRTGKEE